MQLKSSRLTFIVILIFTNFISAQVPDYIPSNGLVGWWPFNSNANDESGNNNNGTVNGATLTLDRFNNANSAYVFNGTTNYIEVPHSSSQNFSGGQSVSFWINRTGMISATGDQNHILSKGAELYNGQNIWAGDVNNYINYHYINGSYTTLNSCQTVQDSFASNNWVHYMVTNNLSSINVYINGNLVQTCPLSNPSTTLAGTNEGPMYFGKGRGHFAGERGFQGLIDDIGIWNRALTIQEVTDLYNGSQVLSVVSFPSNANTIKLYPNPASTDLTVSVSNFNLMQEYALQIVNTLGQTIYNAPIKQKLTTINLNGFKSKGLYFVQVLDLQNHVMVNKKIIIQ